jgi:rubrerythrin
MGIENIPSEGSISNTLHNLVQTLSVKLDSAARYGLYQEEARREGFDECGEVFARLATTEQESIQRLVGCIQRILPDARSRALEAREPAVGTTAADLDAGSAVSTSTARGREPEGADASASSGSAAARTGASEQVTVDELPAELRSRVMAATANAHYRLVKRSSAENEFGVYAMAGDRFVGMLLALLPGGSVDEATDTFLVDAVVDVRVLGDEATIDVRDADRDRQIVVPAEIADALAEARGVPANSGER